jgi:hypothetical protein
MKKKLDMFFASYEAIQTPPLAFQWQHVSKPMEIQPKDIIFKGELINREEAMNAFNKRTYILTKHCLFKCTDISPINISHAALELRNPNIKKIENIDINL